MNTTTLAGGLFAVAALGLLASVEPSHAQLNQTFVSGTGSDGNPCSRTLPCRTYGTAHAKTNAGGTISVLDSNFFGVVTITKSISIVAEGVEGAVAMQAALNGVTVNAGAGDVVTLRGLVFDGHGAGIAGVQFNSGAALHVRNCVMKNFVEAGIRFEPSGAGKLFVSDCNIVNTGGPGILVRPVGTAAVQATINRVRSENNDIGISAIASAATGSVQVTVRDSVAAGNASRGIAAVSGNSGGAVNMMLDRITSANNGTFGVFASRANSTIRISGSTITGNGRGLRVANGGTIVSFGNNSVAGNAVDGNPSTTIALQ
jgi:hypothetical protein